MISLVVAFDNQWAIGRKNQLLCNLPNDLKNFKRITEGGTVVMGRKTWESLPAKPLPNRQNIILSRSWEHTYNETGMVVNNVDDIIDSYIEFDLDEHGKEMFIIGGSQIYSEFINYADRLYITKIHHTFRNTDTFFPSISLWDWEVTEITRNYKDSRHAYDYDFIIMDRRIYNDEA